MVVKVTGAAGWVFPPELRGKQPLYPKGTALGKEQAPGSLSLLWEGIWGLPYGFPSACVLSASSLPALGTSEHGDLGQSSRSQHVCMAQDGEGWRDCRELHPFPLPRGFFGHGLAVLKPPRKGNLIRALLNPTVFAEETGETGTRIADGVRSNACISAARKWGRNWYF